MNRSVRPLRSARHLSDSVQRRLNMYAIAAAAAGVGTIALAPSAQAKIVYTRTHRVINDGQHYNLDLNHDGVVDFVLANSVRCNTDQCFYDLIEKPHSGNAAIGVTRGSFLPYASALHAGSPIGPKRQFVGSAILGYVYQGGGGTSSRGPWDNVSNRYLGLQFHIRGKVHYGWARLSVKISGTTVSATLTGFAYETIANKPIIAGATTGADQGDAEGFDTGTSLTKPIPDTPQPASLGTLALGALGVLWRREESGDGTTEN
jgi:hypothetical protein